MEKIKANNAKGVMIPANEAHLFHLKLVKKEANHTTKEFEDRGITQVFTAVDFAQMDKSGFFKQYDEVIILHNPNKKDTEGELTDEEKEAAKNSTIGGANTATKQSAGTGKETAAQKKVRESNEKAETEKSKANAGKAEQLTNNGGAAPVIPEVVNGPGGAVENNGTQKDEATLAIELQAARDEYKTLHGGEEAPEDFTIDQLNGAIETKKGF